MPDNPFPPKPTEYSLDEPEVLPPISHPSFKLLDPDKQLDVLTDAIVTNMGKPLEVILRDTGISREEYKELISDPQYINMVEDKATKEFIVPRLPHMYDTIAIKSTEGDPAAVKTTLQIIGKIAPADTMVDVKLLNLSDAELTQRAKRLHEELMEDAGDE